MLETLVILTLALYQGSIGHMWASGALAGIGFMVGVNAVADWLKGPDYPTTKQ